MENLDIFLFFFIFFFIFFFFFEVDVLCLAESEEPFFNVAFEATASLWQDTYNEMYPKVEKHQFFRHQKEVSMFSSFAASPEYVAPRRYAAAIFDDKACPVVASLPNISITAEDVKLDLQWIPQLQKEFRALSNTAYQEMGIVGKVNDRVVCERLFESYHRFLFLCKTMPSLGHKLAPPVSIDLLWHAHQITPQLYMEETTRTVGFHLRHDPWPNNSKDLRDMSSEFACAWKKSFGTDLSKDHTYQSK